MGCAPSKPAYAERPREPISERPVAVVEGKKQSEDEEQPQKSQNERRRYSKRMSMAALARLPPPCRPATSRDDIFDPAKYKNWDNRAILVKNYGIPNDFDTLARYLTDGASTALQKLRVIYCWITTQDCHAVEDSVQTDFGSPLGYLAALKREHGSYSDFFYRICSAAGLVCMTIQGYAKGVGYQPGQPMNKESFAANWNAVLVDKYWRLIDVHWGARFIVGDDKKDDWKLIDSDTSAAVRQDQTLTYNSDDFYFLADPEKLIYSHFPYDPQWQLLDEPYNLTTFEKQAFIKRHFFKLGLNLKSHPLAVIDCPTGETDIQFALPMSTHVAFSYKLFTVGGKSSTTVSNANKLNQFVVQQTMNKIISFALSFPFTGKFLVELYACSQQIEKKEREEEEFMNHVCSYIINCTKAKPDCKALPPTASVKGFGPGIDALRKQLEPVTHKSGVIITEDGQVEITFQLTGGPIDFATFLHSNDYPDSLLSNYVVHRLQGDQAIFSVNLPGPGEYSLDIFGELQSNQGSKTLPHVCSYLIRCREPVKHPPFAPTVDGMFGLCLSQNKQKKLGEIKFNPSDAFIISDSGEVSIEIESPDNLSFMGILEHQTAENQTVKMNEYMFTEKTGTTSKLNLLLPHQGYYRMGIYAKDKNSENGTIHEVFNYCIYSSSAHPDLLKFPGVFADWKEDCVLYEPKQGLLPNQDEVNFSLLVPDAQSVFVVPEKGGDPTALQRVPEEPDTWTGTVPTGPNPGDLQVAAVYPNSDQPLCLLKFEVLSAAESAEVFGEGSGQKEGEGEERSDEGEMKERELEAMQIREEEEALAKRETELAQQEQERAAAAEAAAEAELLAAQTRAQELDDEAKRLEAEKALRLAKEQADEKKRQRIRKQLKAAIKQRDKRELVEALRLFEEFEIPDTEGDYLEGQELLVYFKLRQDLLKAIKSREIPKLQAALAAVRKSSRDMQHKVQLETAKAERILESLKHIEKLRHAIMKLDQKTIAEIKNYANPPVEVHQIFKATFLLLGTPLKLTEKWNDTLVQIGKLGRESLKRRISSFNVTSVSLATAEKADGILKPYTLNQVRNVSAGAAAFFVWAKGVIKEVYTKKEDDVDEDAEDEDV